MQRRYQIAIVVFTALLMLSEHFLIPNPITELAREVRSWGIVISAFALGLGTVNLATIHARRLQALKQGWLNSAVLIIAMAAFALVGITQGTSTTLYRSMHTAVIAPSATAMFGTLIFYIVSAAYRSFVARKAESAVILVSALIVMLAQIPVGGLISPLIPEAAKWLQDIPNNAGQRGLVIGAAIGAVANGLRVMLGLERNFGS